MKNKQLLVFVSLVSFIFLTLLLISLNLSWFPFDFSITGKSALISGGVFFSIGEHEILIQSPENKTYNFETSSESYYVPIYDADLNVSATFEASNWRYYLKQTTSTGGTNDFMSGIFYSNTTMKVYRWHNNLTVYALDSSLNEYSKSVMFYVYVNNSAPIIDYINPNLYVCENDVLRYYFNASDRDEDYLTSLISPSDPFYVGNPTRANVTITRFRITSRIMGKNYVGGINVGSKIYSLVVSVSDGEYPDSKNTNITAIEINNPPQMENIGVQTVWTHGDDSVFHNQVKVEDIEDGDSYSGNLNFSIEFLNSEKLFDINETGWMYFKPNQSHLEANSTPKTYYLTVCSEDRGIENPYFLIEEKCNKTGESIKTCQNFGLTVTDENRPPIITSYSPSNLSIAALGTENLYFNVSVYDPDGTIPDIYWYVKGDLKKYTSENLEDGFDYKFGCGVSGTREIKVEITDGLINDSVEWDINITNVPCPAGATPSSGGGGASGAAACLPEWACGDWNICQNLERSLKAGFLTGENYRKIKKGCEEIKLNEITCGFQIRECIDLKTCNLFSNISPQIQACYFVEEPSCFDSIQNCHSGGCEIGIDCGWPCSPCPTCSDKVQNQGEAGIDCGGPCPWPCPEEIPLRGELKIVYLIVGLLFISLIILIIKLIRVAHYRKILLNKKNK